MTAYSPRDQTNPEGRVVTAENDHSKHPSVIAFAARAAASVAAADTAADAAVMADFSEAEEIGVRSDPVSFNPHGEVPPKDPAKRAQNLREQITNRQKGLAALSSYDINVSGPFRALHAALGLEKAHINCGLTMSHNLRPELAGVLRALGQSPQIALFSQ